MPADPARGGTLARLTDQRTGRELLAGPGNELVLQEEYAQHPRWGEGPWLLSTEGTGPRIGGRAGAVRAERCPVGSRLVAEFSVGDLRVPQETLLWDGAERVEFRTHVDGSIGQDRLLRVAVPGRGGGRPAGLPERHGRDRAAAGSADTDVGRARLHPGQPGARVVRPGLDRAGRADRRGGRAPRCSRSGSPRWSRTGDPRRAARAGPRPDGRPGPGRGDGDLLDGGRPRYGSIDVDSNLPDFRIALGGPAQNPFTGEVLAAASPAVTAELAGPAGRNAARPGSGCPPPRAGPGPSLPEPTCAARGTCRC